MNNENQDGSLKIALGKGLSHLMVIICGILFFFFIYKFPVILSLVIKIASILSPVIFGLALGYLINPMMAFFEKKIDELFEKGLKNKPDHDQESQSGTDSDIEHPNEQLKPAKKIVLREKTRKSLARILAIIICFALFILFIFLLGAMIIPLIRENIMNLAKALPSEINKVNQWLESHGIYIYQYLDETFSSQTGVSSDTISLDSILSYVFNWIQNDMLNQMSTVVSTVVGFFSVILNLFVGCIVAIYVLMSKETFKRQGKKLVYALFSEDTAGNIFELFRQSNRIFGGFISGKVIDSVIIGVLCFIGCLLLGIPYAALVSVIVGVTNIIPFFGPYIGGVPSAILVMLANPLKGAIFIAFVILLQQFDGNILGPRILGESTGLSPFWIIVAILLGGGLFGVPGMLLGVPTFAVVYYMIKTFVNSRLEKKDIKV